MTPPRVASSARLARWLDQQRWCAHGAEAVEVVDLTRVELGTTPAVAVAVATTAGGERYQLIQSDATPDRADQPKTATALARFVAAGGTAAAAAGAGGTGAAGADAPMVQAHWTAPANRPLGTAAARPLGADQSNTSVAVGGTHVMKVLRRLQPGTHPEVEVGLHLATAPTAPVARLAGWYELTPADANPDSDPDAATVLGVVHELVPAATDGWALVLSALAAEPNAVLARLRSLGVAVADLHGALARPGSGSGATFGQAPFDATEVWALADRIRTDPAFPDIGHARVAHAVDAIGTDTGAAIRTHGDLHLGQTLLGAGGWVILDFEGEPTRPLAERTRHTSPLRDVAGMLRSLSYARAAHDRTGARPLTAGWEAGARAALLDGYFDRIDPALLPTSSAITQALLTLFELEKVVYEIAYEQAHRPDWVAIPQAGLASLLARGTP